MTNGTEVYTEQQKVRPCNGSRWSGDQYQWATERWRAATDVIFNASLIFYSFAHLCKGKKLHFFPVFFSSLLLDLHQSFFTFYGLSAICNWAIWEPIRYCLMTNLWGQWWIFQCFQCSQRISGSKLPVWALFMNANQVFLFYFIFFKQIKN